MPIFLYMTAGNEPLTNDQGNHGSSVSSGGFEPLDELFNLPYFDVLFSLVRLRCAHDGQQECATSLRRPGYWKEASRQSEGMLLPRDAVIDLGRRTWLT